MARGSNPEISSCGSAGTASYFLIGIRVRHRGAVPPKMKKTKNLTFSPKGHEKPDLNPELCHDSVKFAY